MAGCTWIWDFVLFRHGRVDEGKGVSAHLDICDCRFNLGHVARNALAPRRAVFVMRVLLQSSCPRTIERHRAVAIQAELLGRLSELRVVIRAVYVVATEAGNPVLVHHALHEIIPLHPILMRCAVRKVRKGQLAEGVLFQLPEILQMESRPKADGPIIVFSLDRTG